MKPQISTPWASVINQYARLEYYAEPMPKQWHMRCGFLWAYMIYALNRKEEIQKQAEKAWMDTKYEKDYHLRQEK